MMKSVTSFLNSRSGSSCRVDGVCAAITRTFFSVYFYIDLALAVNCGKGLDLNNCIFGSGHSFL